MSTAAEFRFKDIFLAFGYASNREKLIVGAGGFLISILISGIWMLVFSFIFTSVRWLTGMMIFNFIGMLIFVALMSATITAVSYMVRSELDGKGKPGYSDVFRFITKQIVTIVSVPYAFIGILLACGILQALIGLICRIPWIGAIVYGAAYGILFAISLIMIITVMVFYLGIFLYPAIIATHGYGLVDTIKTLFRAVRQKWIQLIGYLVIVGFLSSIVFFVAYLLFGAAFSITTSISALVIGKNAILTTSSVAGRMLNPFLHALRDIFPLSAGSYYGGGAWYHTIGGILQMIWLAVILSVTFAYPLVFNSSAGVMVYHILMKPGGAEKKKE
ncbi:hypothetical protein JXJ21_01475 [candidate division KSB1 bacterium]|nr:hypothetical protein [candidate division KSB1 bacterium]